MRLLGQVVLTYNLGNLDGPFIHEPLSHFSLLFLETEVVDLGEKHYVQFLNNEITKRI